MVVRSPDGTHAELIDASGDGWGNVFVAGSKSFNAFRITSEGAIKMIIGPSSDGGVNTFQGPRNLAVDAVGNVIIASWVSHNVFEVEAFLFIDEFESGNTSAW